MCTGAKCLKNVQVSGKHISEFFGPNHTLLGKISLTLLNLHVAYYRKVKK